MVCKLPDNFRRAMERIANCQRAYPNEAEAPCGALESNQMRKVGANFIGRGNFREAYAFRQKGQDCVVKVSNSMQHRKHNQIEEETWKGAPSKFRPLLTPVTDADPAGQWLVMPRAKVNELDMMERSAIGVGIEAAMGMEGWECPDLHTGNVGKLDGKPVAIDYGFGLSCVNRRRLTEGTGRAFTTLSKTTRNMQERQLDEFNREIVQRTPLKQVLTQWIFTPEGKLVDRAKERERLRKNGGDVWEKRLRRKAEEDLWEEGGGELWD